jgi:pre-rRNA-processing protein IPI3
LKEQLGKAKGVNDAMWENVVQKVLKGDSVKAVGDVGDRDGEGGLRRKRGRIE